MRSTLGVPVMQVLTKVLGSGDHRKSRFHTRRGQLLPIHAWPQLISSARQRVSRHQPTTPWLASSAVAFLDESIQATWNVFEFGSGASTAWYAQRAGTVESVENNPEWHRQVSEQLAHAGVENCTLTWLDSSRDFPSYLEQYSDDSFDLVVVDGYEARSGHRIECLKVAKSKTKPGGLIVLDDSDRLEYRAADDILMGWTVRRFISVKPFPLASVETSVFIRPLEPTESTE